MELIFSTSTPSLLPSVGTLGGHSALCPSLILGEGWQLRCRPHVPGREATRISWPGLRGGADQTHEALWLPRPPALKRVEGASDQTPEKFLVNSVHGCGEMSTLATGTTWCRTQTNRLHRSAQGRLSVRSGVQAKLRRCVFTDRICLPVCVLHHHVTQHRST